MQLVFYYFLTPTVFYLYTVWNSKKYDRKLTWCENASKINKKYLTSVPLLIIGFISYFIISQKNVNYSLLVINFTSYIFWIFTIYRSRFDLHPTMGLIYTTTLIIISSLIVLNSKYKVIPVCILFLGIILNIFVFLDIVKNKNICTRHEEIQAICFTLYHIAIQIN